MNTILSSAFAETFDKNGNKVSLPGEFPALPISEEMRQYVPTPHKEYTFRKGELRTILSFLARPHGSGFFLFGPTGSGKTSLVEEVAARLGWPVFSVTLNERMELTDLRGSWVYEQSGEGSTPVMRFLSGPALKAFAEGGILLMNEVDVASPGILSGLNDLIEGRSIYVPELKKQINPHPLFRVIATANSSGQGDETGAYSGVQSQNCALFNRMRSMQVGYPTEEVERELVSKVFQTEGLSANDARSFATDMVALATRVRAESTALKGIDGTLSCVLSTRNLVTWAKVALDYAACPGCNFLKAGLEEVLLNRASEADRTAITSYCQAIFGSHWAE